MPLRYLTAAILFAMFTAPASTTQRAAAADLAAELEPPLISHRASRGAQDQQGVRPAGRALGRVSV
jgi:hypothetical protein